MAVYREPLRLARPEFVSAVPLTSDAAVDRKPPVLDRKKKRDQLVAPEESRWAARIWWLYGVEEWAPTFLVELHATLDADDPREAIIEVLARHHVIDRWFVRHCVAAWERWAESSVTLPELYDAAAPTWPVYPKARAEGMREAEPTGRDAKKRRRLRDDLADEIAKDAGWRKNPTIDRRWLRAAVEHKIMGRTIEEIGKGDDYENADQTTIERGINAVLKAAGLRARHHKRGPKRPRG